MTTPRWSTFGLFACLVIQLTLSFLLAKKKRRPIRDAILPNALIAGAGTIILIREFFEEVPAWIEVTAIISVFLLIAVAAALGFTRFKTYLKKSWSLERDDEQ